MAPRDHSVFLNQETLAKLHQIWKRPVLLSTKREGKGGKICFEGKVKSLKNAVQFCK